MVPGLVYFARGNTSGTAWEDSRSDTAETVGLEVYGPEEEGSHPEAYELVDPEADEWAAGDAGGYMSEPERDGLDLSDVIMIVL